jgi:dihydroorotate dehydrogenase electron transfer subunit
MTHFADCASYCEAPLLKNEELAKDTRLMRVQAPHMAARAVPGQFFMVRDPLGNDPLIGRAFAIYDCGGAGEGWVDIVYLVKGKLTTRLAQKRVGDRVAVWGPLGNGFSTTPVQQLVMVAGGIGQTPFLSLAREALGLKRFGEDGMRSSGYAASVHFCYGVRGREYLAGVSDFEAMGVGVSIATDDGSVGSPRRVTEALTEFLDRSPQTSTRIVCCGPEPMMEAVAKIAATRGLPCEVSLETPMACGVGICFTCVAKVGSERDWDYKRTCVEGPIFDAAQILW